MCCHKFVTKLELHISQQVFFESRIQDAFIEIIGYYGFNISRQLVVDFQAAGQTKNDNNRKPVIGIHFRDGCCLKDGQIVKYATPQYTSRQTGWHHRCEGENKINCISQLS